jgi:hypothetical protein
MAQRYRHTTALARMAEGRCPECGEVPAAHSNSPEFWLPRRCDLTFDGVGDRIAQHQSDIASGVQA